MSRGWPNQKGRAIARLKLLLAVLLLCHAAGATQSAPLKVRGAASVSASARVTGATLEVRGSVTDDAGSPMGRAHLRVDVLSDSGKARDLPRAEKCPPTQAVQLARGFSSIPDAYIVETDAAGGFCLRVPGHFESGSIEISFEDNEDLFEASTETIPIDTTRRSLALRFSPQPLRLNLAPVRHLLFIDTELKPPLAPGAEAEPIRLDLMLSEADGKATRIATTTLLAGGRGQFEVTSSKLGRPGRATLSAVFAGTETIQPAERRLVVSRTAQVELSLAAAGDTHPWSGDTVLPVAVGFVGGAVPSGSVEARVMGRTVGIAPVRAGAATLRVKVEASRRREVTVTLHYLPDAPWWIPGPPVEAQVMTVSPASWMRWTWALLAGLVAGWTFLAWRRPRPRLPKEQPSKAPTGKARLEIVRRIAPNSGWVGSVIDAHDGEPIEHAELEILGPSFRQPVAIRSARTARDGAFSLEPIPAPWPDGTVLRVSSVHHATFEQPLPVEGQLVIHLATRRRALLERLVQWTERRGQPYTGGVEPTPGRVAQVAESEHEFAVNDWARAVEHAAYGPSPPDAQAERSLVKREPDS